MSDNEITNKNDCSDYENKSNHNHTEEVILKEKDIEDKQIDEKEKKTDILERTELNATPVNDIPSINDLNNEEKQKLTLTSEPNNYIEISKRESKSTLEISNLNNMNHQNTDLNKDNNDEDNSLINNSINIPCKEEAVHNHKEVDIAKDEENKNIKNEQDSIFISNSDLKQNLISEKIEHIENIKDDEDEDLNLLNDIKLDINNEYTNNKTEEIELNEKNQEKYQNENDNENNSNKSNDYQDNNNSNNYINEVNIHNEESHGYLKNNMHLNKLIVTMNNETQNSYIPTLTSLGNKKEENIINSKNSKKNYSIYNNPKFKNLLEELEKNCSPNIALNNLVNNSYKHQKQYSNVEYLDNKNTNNRYKEFYSILSNDMNYIIKQNNQNKNRILTSNKSTIKEEIIYNRNPIVNPFSKNTQIQENKLISKIEKYNNISTHRILSNNYNVSSSNIFKPSTDYYKNNIKINSNYEVSKYESLFKNGFNSSNLKKNYSLGNLATINYGCINNLNNFEFNNTYKSYNSSYYNGFTKYSNKDNLILLRSMPKLKYNEFKEKEHQFKSIYISNSSTLNNTNANNNTYNTNTNSYNTNRITPLSLSTKNRNYNCSSTYDTENSSNLLFKKRIESIYTNNTKKVGCNEVKLNLYNESFKTQKTAIYSNNERIIKQINNELNKNKFKFIELNRNLDKRNISLN